MQWKAVRTCLFVDEDYDYVIYIWRCNHRECEDGQDGEDHDEVPAGDEGSTTHASSAASHYSDDPEELKIIYVICKGGLLTDTQTLLLKIETFTMGKHFFQPLCLRLFLSWNSCHWSSFMTASNIDYPSREQAPLIISRMNLSGDVPQPPLKPLTSTKSCPPSPSNLKSS